MKTSAVILLAVLAAAPALADTTPVPAPVPPAATAKLSVDSPIEVLAADPKAKAVLDANFPGMTDHPMYNSFKNMSLKQVQPMSGGRVTDAAIAATAAGLAAIK